MLQNLQKKLDEFQYLELLITLRVGWMLHAGATNNQLENKKIYETFCHVIVCGKLGGHTDRECSLKAEQ